MVYLLLVFIIMFLWEISCNIKAVNNNLIELLRYLENSYERQRKNKGE